MIDSTGSGHVGHERAARSPELVVEPDAGREGQDPGSDAGAQALGSARAVAFEAQDVLEGPKDRLDALADPAQARPRVLGLVLAGGSHDVATQLGHRPLEGAAGIALVADDRLAAAKHMGQQIEGDRALLAVGPDELSTARGAVGSAAQVQAHPPEEAAVATAGAAATAASSGGCACTCAALPTAPRAVLSSSGPTARSARSPSICCPMCFAAARRSSATRAMPAAPSSGRWPSWVATSCDPPARTRPRTLGLAWAGSASASSRSFGPSRTSCASNATARALPRACAPASEPGSWPSRPASGSTTSSGDRAARSWPTWPEPVESII